MTTKLKTKFATGKKVTLDGNYFIGFDRDGLQVFMPKPSYDCGWYWGFGYLHGYKPTKRSDYEYSQFFSNLKGYRNINYFDAFNEFFATTILTDSQVWQLCDYMSSFYALQDFAEKVGRGQSNYGKTPHNYQDKALAERINKIMLPELFKAIEDLFTAAQCNYKISNGAKDILLNVGL